MAGIFNISLEQLMRMQNIESRLPRPGQVIEDKNVNKEAERRKKRCECGYDPSNDDHCDREDRCPNKLALCNHVTFPSFRAMTELNDPSSTYYELTDMFRPKRHWATLLDIYQYIGIVRPGVLCFNRFGELISVHFYHERDQKATTFNFESLKPGHTLCILYPERKTFGDLTEGIREENLDSCYVFNATLKEVEQEAQKLLNDADVLTPLAGEAQQVPVCFNCGVKSEKLSHCGACKLAKYCSKECQVSAWASVHKKLCKQSETLLRVSVLPRYSFQNLNHFSFDSNSKSYLPPYKQESATRHRKKRF